MPQLNRSCSSPLAVHSTATVLDNDIYLECHTSPLQLDRISHSLALGVITTTHPQKVSSRSGGRVGARDELAKRRPRRPPLRVHAEHRLSVLAPHEPNLVVPPTKSAARLAVNQIGVEESNSQRREPVRIFASPHHPERGRSGQGAELLQATPRKQSSPSIPRLALVLMLTDHIQPNLLLQMERHASR